MVHSQFRMKNIWRSIANVTRSTSISPPFDAHTHIKFPKRKLYMKFVHRRNESCKMKMCCHVLHARSCDNLVSGPIRFR